MPGSRSQNQSNAYLGTQRKSGDEDDADYTYTQLRESNTPSVWINHDNRGSTLQTGTIYGDPALQKESTNVIIISGNNDPNAIY